MSELQKIRIKLKAYDHALLEGGKQNGNQREDQSQTQELRPRSG